MRHDRTRLAAVLVGIALLATACGDDDDTAAPPTTGSSDTSASTAGVEGDPVVVGFHTLEGGAVSIPEIRIGWEQGVRYVNEELGGINGRPFESIVCKTDGSPESSIDCANQFIEGGAVAAVQGFDLGAEATVPVLTEAGIAQMGFVPSGPQQTTDVGHSFYFGSATQGFIVGALLAMRDEGAERVQYFLLDDPTRRDSSRALIEPAGEELGLDVELVFYDPAGADWASLVSTALAGDADAIATDASEPDCISLMTAVTQLAFDGPVFAGACSAFIDAVGAEAVEGTLTYSDLYNPTALDGIPDDKAANLQSYIDFMTDAGHEDLIEGYAQLGFETALDVADALGQLESDGEELTAATVLDGMPSVSGERFMGGEYNCDGSAWPGETACSLGVLIYRTTADGGRELASDGFLDLSDYRPAS